MKWTIHITGKMQWLNPIKTVNEPISCAAYVKSKIEMTSDSDPANQKYLSRGHLNMQIFNSQLQSGSDVMLARIHAPWFTIKKWWLERNLQIFF